MTNFAHPGDVQIDRTHNAAIRREIGDLLRISLNAERLPLTPSLMDYWTGWRRKIAARRVPNSTEAVLMKDFPNASFPPETIGIMKTAMDGAVATLPHPVSSAAVQSIAETILRTAQEGETDPKTLERMALLELQISER